MKKITRRRFLELATLSATAATLAACGSASESTTTSADGTETSTSSAEQELDFVELKMVLIGDVPVDIDVVYGAINEKLKEDINANVVLEYLSWADYSQRYPLLLTQHDGFDLINAANWNNYFNYSREGAFMEITEEMLEQNAPQTYANSTLDSALVDGALYALPMEYNEITIDGYIVRGDIMDAAGLTEIASIDDFEAYLDFAKNNYPDMLPWDTSDRYMYLFRSSDCLKGAGLRDISTGNGNGPIVAPVEANAKLLATYDKPEYLAFCQRMKKWMDAGYMSKNALVNTVQERDAFLNGSSACFIDNMNQASATYSTVSVNHPEWDMRFYPITTNPLVANPFINNGMAISANTKHADRALMMLDLFRYDKWYNQTTTYGIQGTHWDVDANGNYIALDKAVDYIADASCPWGWRNQEFYLTPGDSFSNYSDIMNHAVENVYVTNIASFTPDKTAGNVSAIEAAMFNIGEQYQKPLMVGISSDVEADIATLKQQYETAGIIELMEEYQAQLDAFGVTVE